MRSIYCFTAGTHSRCVFLARLAIWGLGGLWLPALMAQAAPLEEPAGPAPFLKTVVAVRKLSPQRADRHLPVRLSAVVTYFDPHTDYLFVQDQTGGVFVRGARGTNFGAQLGQLLEIEGVTEYGPFGSGVAQPRIRSEGKGRMPAPWISTVENLYSGGRDLRWVEVQGIVQAVEQSPDSGEIALDVGVIGNNFKAQLSRDIAAHSLPATLVDSRVKLRGVVVPISSRKGELLGFELFVPSLESIEVVRAASADPFARPLRSIDGLLQRDANSSPGYRIKIRGTVTLRWDDRRIYLQDSSGGICAELNRPFAGELGTRIELVGFARPGNSAAQLHRSEWRTLEGPPVPVSPIKTTAREVRRGDLDGMLVKLEGVLNGRVRHQDVEVLTLQSGNWSFEAHLRTNQVTGGTALEPGTRVRVTGVCEAAAGDHEHPGSFRLLLRSQEDVVILALPPWWTISRVLTVFGCVILVAALWLLIYSRKVSGLQRKYSQLFENASDLVCSLDMEGCFLALNKAGEKITGYLKSQARGQKFEELVIPEHRDRFREWWNRLLSGKEAGQIELSIETRGGEEVALEVSGHFNQQSHLPDSVEAIARNITVRKQSEEQRLLMERKMLDGQKLESLGVMAGGIAHDFNNLLTAILGNATLAGLTVADDSSAKNHLLSIEKASRQAADLCKQLLAYSGKGRFISQRIDLNALIEDMRQLLQISISRKAVLEIEGAEELPVIEADPSQIRQVLMNLVINASEALEGRNGIIRVRTGVAYADSGTLAGAALATDLEPGEYAYFEVIDTGCGMDRQTVTRIFDPFYTTKFIGRGLGLAAVSGIVRAHRGALQITSEPGHGSTFRVLIPYVNQPAETAPTPSPEAADWRGSGTVLLADDEAGVRVVARQMLKSFGFQVLEAANGEEAIRLFRQRPSQIVAVVLDLTMPHLSGEETLQALRRIRPETPVLLMSGFSEQEAMKRCGSSGALEFLPKPFKPEELREKMHSILIRKAELADTPYLRF